MIKSVVFRPGSGRIIDYRYQPSGENPGWTVTLHFRQDEPPFTPDAFMYDMPPHMLPQILITLQPEDRHADHRKPTSSRGDDQNTDADWLKAT